MTQHEYVFVAISITLGLAITRLLHSLGMLIRAHRRVTFHWSTALWAVSVMAYTLQLWWVGWELREIEQWQFVDFIVMTLGSIFIYGAAEMALPVPEGNGALDFLEHSRSLGRLSALSMLLYFCVGPYVNIALFHNEMLASLLVPAAGAAIAGLIIWWPRGFPVMSVAFATYTAGILAITA